MLATLSPKFLSTPPSPNKMEDIRNSDQIEYDMVKYCAKLSTESIEDRLARYLEYFTVPVAHLRNMVAAFEHELKLGLQLHYKHPEGWDRRLCSFKMLDSCIGNLPRGTEEGIFYAMDFGGTNFRVVRTDLKGNGKVQISQCKRSLLGAPNASHLPKGLLDRKASATLLFDFFSSTCRDFMVQQNDSTESSESNTKEYKGAFTFSFPCTQLAINSATLMEWTKGFETGRDTMDKIEKMDVVALLNAGFDRFRVPMDVVAVLNDTVGTMLSGCYETNRENHPPCLVGLILGTGVNACYYEKEAPDYGYQGRVINIECGNFNRELPSTNVDYELDFAEFSNRGRQRFEKMISGAYVGEIVRRAIVKVLQNQAPSRAWMPFSLTSEHVSTIIDDKCSDFSTTEALLLELWNHTFAYSELSAINQLALAIMNRAAALSAVIVAATARKSQHLQPAMGGVSVAIDGSMYKCVPYFQRQLRVHLDKMLGKVLSGLIHLITADDGSGKGAAICASIMAPAKA